MTRSEIKKLAKQQLEGNVGKLLLCALVVSVIIGSISMMFASTSIPLAAGSEIERVTNSLMFSISNSCRSYALSILIAPAFAFGLILIYLDVRNGKGVRIEKVFEPFKIYPKVFVLYFLEGLFVILWSLLLVVPGIVKSYSYAMAPYILAENPEMSGLDAINESKKMMKGNKGKLFILDLSFIGWILLGLVTLGIVFIYVSPYMELARINFYDSVKGGNAPEFSEPTVTEE